MKPTETADIVESSGNVFADLQVEEPEAALAKAEIAHAISEIIDARQLTQAQAAALLEIDQPKVSALVRGRLSGFSIDRMLRFLVALDRDVEIVIRLKAGTRDHGRVSVTAGSQKPGGRTVAGR
jgi:predicted XRE-type DNA-binding protein